MVLRDGEFRFVFTAKDYAKSVAFYRDDLELPVHHDWDYGPDDKGTVFFAGPGLIEIFSPVGGATFVKPAGVGMLLRVADVDEWYQRALALQLPVIQEPTTYPWGHRVMRLTDPDGIVVSLYSPVE